MHNEYIHIGIVHVIILHVNLKIKFYITCCMHNVYTYWFKLS